MSSELIPRQATPEGPFGDYFLLPKRMGTVDSGTLLGISINLDNHLRNPNVASNPVAHMVAGSALVEASMFYPDPSFDHVDFRISLIDKATEHFTEAAELEFERLERGFSHPNDQTQWKRAELQIAFDKAYKDIVCGEVTDTTREELLESLHDLDTYLKRLQKQSGQLAGPAFGLAGEVQTIRALWQRGIYAIPSTARGGDGSFNPAETHDFEIIELDSKGKIKNAEPVEVKSGRGLRLQHLGRYSVSIVHRTKKGMRSV